MSLTQAEMTAASNILNDNSKDKTQRVTDHSRHLPQKALARRGRGLGEGALQLEREKTALNGSQPPSPSR
jgi:hypothetical protein